MSDFAKQIHNLTDYNIPTPVKEQNKVIDEIVNVATNGGCIHPKYKIQRDIFRVNKRNSQFLPKAIAKKTKQSVRKRGLLQKNVA